MNIRTIALTTVLLFSGSFAFAETVHLPQAVEHTKAAITHGNYKAALWLPERPSLLGGHRDLAGGQIVMSTLADQQKSSLPSKLITKFLKMLKRENVTSKPLVHDD